ncbi:MAG: single-stranded-DNA-specific exonuclease RecJ, partial [Candidatus Omnitrophota bacterium]
LNQVISAKEKVFIATDFDVDGVTSCALLETVLKRFGVPVRHYMPHRVKNGYGLNAEAVAFAKEFKASLFVSLDCGVTAFEEMKALKEAKIDAVIIDHHEPKDHLPPALAILDPKQKTCPYPFKDLATVGLVYKLIQALEVEGALEYLDLVALGTVADVASLTDENRIFVKHGLDTLNSTKRKGLCSLMDVAGIREKKISTHSISFILAPRINASGRMDSADMSLDLLLTQCEKESERLAKTLHEHNRQRQRVEEKVMTEALDLIEREINFKDDFVIVLSKEDWHPGVLGIVASKIADRFYRPAVVISLKDDIGKGSARSVHNFHIYEALVRCDHFLKEFGGHQYAAGLTIERKNLKEFRSLLNEVARTNMQRQELSPVLEIDAQIPFALINEELLSSIDRLSPFGEENPRPVFMTRNLSVRSKPSVVGRNSLKFWVSDGEATFEAIGFGLGDFFGMVADSKYIDLAYVLGWDQWDSNNLVQLEVKDIKISGQA